ncbi:MAG: FAD-dependent oxidoreductase [Acutalibacteraceae bacterium]|nr:FAD-dependent oxidoreductase [Acutalibacteraceae bacterium]
MKSLWKMTADMPSFPELKKDIKTDVLVIGGGICGILTAYFLKKKGIDYTLVEKGRLCDLTTGNTTAKITFQHGLIYYKLLKDEGKEKAQIYLRSNKEALEDYRELCKSIDCDFEVKDNYVYSLSDRKKLEKEINALSEIGYSAKFFESLPLPFGVKGAVCFPDQAQFNPLKFLSAIAKDLNIYENTFVRELVGTTAITDKGKIRANRIIVATHFPFINKHGLYFMKLYQHRSYVIALEKGIDLGGMYVDEAKKGMSFRNHKDLLLLGGGDHRTGKKGGNWEQLRSFTAIHYPEAREKYFWAAQDCMSLDSIPYIGQYSKSTPNLFVATGFNKWGMTGAMVAAKMLCALAVGKDNPYKELYSPSRNMIKPQLFLNGAESVINLLTPTTKRCPHLGCALKWNSAEHSWDCPCHGSRFTEDGKVLENPANGNIKN